MRVLLGIAALLLLIPSAVGRPAVFSSCSNVDFYKPTARGGSMLDNGASHYINDGIH